MQSVKNYLNKVLYFSIFILYIIFGRQINIITKENNMEIVKSVFGWLLKHKGIAIVVGAVVLVLGVVTFGLFKGSPSSESVED